MGVTEEQLSQALFFRPVGCPKCHNVGYRGRLGMFEVMVMNMELRELAFKHRPLSEIRQAARLLGMRTLVEDGLIKVMRGMTTLEEVLGMASKEAAAT
jgi:type II secretory ATPase GspE/PulE/Tfp pilus assembly ATPase PilB-like protein